MKTIESVLEKLNSESASSLVDYQETLPGLTVDSTEKADNSVDELNIISVNKTCKNCDNTESWGTSRFCPNCGFYPVTGQSYPGFEKAEEAIVEEEITHWTKVIPPWAWLTGSGVIAILLGSIFLGMQISGTPLAKSWGMAQFALAACGVIISHVIAYTYSLHKTDEFGAFSLFLKPFKMWNWVYRSLPESQSEFNCAIWSLTAMIAAPLFISALSFEDITDLYAMRKSSSKGLENAVKEEMVKGNDDEDIEGAMNEFANKASSNVTKMASGPKNKNETPKQLTAPTELESIETDCVVIGFILDEQSYPTHLVLATTINGSLQYVGTALTEKLPPEDIKEFKKRATSLYRPRPLIPAPVNAYWLKPVIAVRVIHKDWTASRKLVEPVISELLADLNAEVKPVGKPRTK